MRALQQLRKRAQNVYARRDVKLQETTTTLTQLQPWTKLAGCGGESVSNWMTASWSDRVNKLCIIVYMNMNKWELCLAAQAVYYSAIARWSKTAESVPHRDNQYTPTPSVSRRRPKLGCKVTQFIVGSALGLDTGSEEDKLAYTGSIFSLTTEIRQFRLSVGKTKKHPVTPLSLRDRLDSGHRVNTDMTEW